ncbi:hypothetical protein KAH37_06740 [bacterium]|nr:hypothetical protein [bacterium]
MTGQALTSITQFLDIQKDGGVFLFSAEDRFSLFSFKKEIRKIVNESSGTEFLEIDYADTAQPFREGLSLAREIGFFTSRRIILIDYITNPKDKERKLIESYMEKPEPTNLLLLFFDAIDKRTTFAKKLKKSKKLQHIPAFSDNQIVTFIKERFAPVIPAQNLINWFLQAEKKELFHIAGEVEKLRLYSLSKSLETIDLRTASTMLSTLSDEIIFGIMNKLCSGNKVAAIAHYRQLLQNDGESKVNPVMINMFMRHFAFMVEVREAKGIQSYDLIRNHRVYYIKPYLNSYVARSKTHTIIAGIELSTRLELAMKGVPGSNVPHLQIGIEQVMLHLF